MNLEDLRAFDSADVYKGGRLAGSLRRLRDGVEFAYLPDYGGPPVAFSLPLGQTVRTGSAGAVPAFFAGLLPEGRRLGALRRAIKTSADDDVSMLLAVGSDAIGDVQVVPAGRLPDSPEPPVDFTGDVLFSDVLGRVLGRTPVDRVGLPGLQDKVSGGMISLPARWRDAPSILKLDPPEFPHLVENEAFFYQAARESGLSVPHTEILRDARGDAGLLVLRFDRYRDGDGWRSLAQEDGCQVLARYPADKYRLTCEDVLRGLCGVVGAPLVAARDLVRQVAFAYLTCNGDAHAKNFSVLQARDGEWQVSPAYDLPSSHPYGDTTVALSIDGRSRENIGRSELLALGRAVSLPERATARVLDELVERAPAWIERLEMLPFDPRILHKLRRAITWRLSRLSGPSR